MLQNGEEKRLANCVDCGIVEQVKTLTWIAALDTVKYNTTHHKAAATQ